MNGLGRAHVAWRDLVAGLPIELDAEALHTVLPHSRLLRLPGLNRDSAQSYGRPRTVATALRLFFTE